MSIKFKPIEKGQPGVVGGGEKKWYAQIVYDEEVTMDELVKEIEKFCSLTEPDIRGVITAFENVIQNKLSASRIVRMERLGSFYPAISSHAEEEESKVDAATIKKVSVNYRPGDRIVKAINDAGFKKFGASIKGVSPDQTAPVI
ncbi:MAG: HU family DNA-binding protein [Prolixibacteraceae bacterium]|nr:HU family DNA-binding protein [Prolixibacteraceae bacterium]